MSIRIHKKGFTLIELLVVIAIIGLLASVVLASLDSARQKGRDAKRLSDAKQLQIVAELYYDDLGLYPPDTGSGMTTGTRMGDIVVTNGLIGAIPTDPSTGEFYRYDRGTDATCSGLGNNQCFAIRIDLENASASACVIASQGYTGGLLGTNPLCSAI